MKKFDLSLAKQGHPVCTRDGRPARIICFDRNDDTYPVVGLVNIEDEETVLTFTAEGQNFYDKESIDDLFMSPEKKRGG